MWDNFEQKKIIELPYIIDISVPVRERFSDLDGDDLRLLRDTEIIIPHDIVCISRGYSPETMEEIQIEPADYRDPELSFEGFTFKSIIELIRKKFRREGKDPYIYFLHKILYIPELKQIHLEGLFGSCWF